MHESWLETHRYFCIDDLREHEKEALRMAPFGAVIVTAGLKPALSASDVARTA